MYKVLKFGGTSLRDKDSISAVSRIIKKNSNHKLIVIVSAMGRYPEPYATDTLKELVSWQLSYDEYSRIVSCGETISSVVLSSELRKKNIKAISLSSLQAGLKVRGNRLVDFDKEKVIEYFKKYDVIKMHLSFLDSRGLINTKMYEYYNKATVIIVLFILLEEWI